MLVTVALAVVYVAACLTMVLTHRATQQRLEARIAGQSDALYKKEKGLGTELARQLAEAASARELATDAFHEAHDETRRLHQQVADIINDPRVRRLLNEKVLPR